MTFQPVVPLPGVAGWRFLEATEATQRDAFDRSAVIERDIAYFEEKIGSITTAEALVSDRRLMTVALGAFGLDEEINKTYFMRRILEEGTDDPESLANQFVDPRYRAFSEAFGFGNLLGTRTTLESFGQLITNDYRERQFEIAVGNANDDMRLALTFRREISEYTSSSSGDDTAWFQIMGSRPLRAVFEAAYGLPQQFGTLDVEKQRETLADKTRELFGEGGLSVFNDPENVANLIDRFLVRRQVDAGPTGSTPGTAALTLLQSASGGVGGFQRINLILSGA